MFREMRRNKQQISREECLRLLQETPRGILSLLGDNGYPYGIPLDHLYSEDDNTLYFHCAKVGHKIDALAACDKASYCVMDQGTRINGDRALTFNSVIVFGRLHIVESSAKKMEICTNLAKKFGNDDTSIREELASAFPRVACLALTVEHISGKSVREA